jgi:hypothetical protein
MNKQFLSILIAAVVVMLLSSCKTTDPGSPFENQPPTTAITSAPQNGTTVNHFISIHWAGNDGDGEVDGYNMFIDGELVAYTLRTDSSISFAAPATGDLVSHTFKIQAVDDDGDVDPTPPEIQFFTSNTAPTCIFSGDNSVGPNANVGQGFQIRLEATDANRSGIWYSLSLDDTSSWTEWSQDSIYMFADLALDTFPSHVISLSNAALTEGAHTMYARCRDSGLALSPIVSRTVNVALDHAPTAPIVVARYNSGLASDSLYPDGSIYQQLNAELALSYESSAFSYRGLIHSYRYRDTDGMWSEWEIEPSLILTNLPVGEYSFAFQARDLAGVESDTTSLFINLVQQVLSDSVIVVDETRNGNGAPSLPTDEQVDVFYASLVDGYKVRNIDINDRQDTDGLVTAGDLKDVGLVIWHADDWSEPYYLDDNRRVLAEYMQRGGRVIFSGWNILGAMGTTTAREYGGTDFEYRYMRLFEAERDGATVQKVTGLSSENGFPAVSVDGTKLLPSWAGAINRTWTFNPRGECTIIGRMATNDPSYFQTGEVGAYYYDLSFRCAVFGLPIYFLNQAEAQALFAVLMPRMLTGL